jgi:chromosome segregation protein
MTRITRLFLHGFKSFAKPTELAFGSKYNCVLGPNGSGKSNIGDAICFVLGKSSSKSLRAEKTANLIYNGGKVKSPAKEANVSIYFSNEEKKFPFDLPEIKVSRMVRANGQSIYSINDVKCTRAEIVNLLSLTHIDPDGHNIILQGDIVRFVEMSAEERRMVMEEVAGIGVYEDRKR